MVDYIPDATKTALIESLAQVRKAALKYSKCLGVQLDGIGCFDAHACAQAEEQYRTSIEEAAHITADVVPPAGLFDDPFPAQEDEAA